MCVPVYIHNYTSAIASVLCTCISMYDILWTALFLFFLQFLNVPSFRNVTLKCLTEIGECVYVHVSMWLCTCTCSCACTCTCTYTLAHCSTVFFSRGGDRCVISIGVTMLPTSICVESRANSKYTYTCIYCSITHVHAFTPSRFVCVCVRVRVSQLASRPPPPIHNTQNSL